MGFMGFIGLIGFMGFIGFRVWDHEGFGFLSGLARVPCMRCPYKKDNTLYRVSVEGSAFAANLPPDGFGVLELDVSFRGGGYVDAGVLV